MKFRVTQENLNHALTTVSRVAASRSSLPILSNVLIKAEKNQISIAATNLEIAITTTISGKVDETGSITVPARLMHDFVSSLPAGNIELELDNHALKISADHYKSTINGVSAEEFPSLPSLKGASKHSLDIPTFKKALQQTVLAASSDEARQVLTAVYMHSHDKKLYMVATDSYRLAEKQVTTIKDDFGLLVPASSLQEVLRLLGDTGQITFAYDEGQVMFDLDGVEIVSRLVEGNYPDYRQLIPNESDTVVTIKRQDFINITKVSSLFARESAGSITIEVSEEDQQISIRSIASQVGENTSKADAEISGEGSVTLNSRYLLDALNSFDSETVIFSFSGKLNPCVLKAGEDSDYLHIVMPLRS